MRGKPSIDSPDGIALPDYGATSCTCTCASCTCALLDFNRAARVPNWMNRGVSDVRRRSLVKFPR